MIDCAGRGQVSDEDISFGVNHKFDIAVHSYGEEVGVGDGGSGIDDDGSIKEVGIGSVGVPDGEGVRESGSVSGEKSAGDSGGGRAGDSELGADGEVAGEGGSGSGE